LNYIETSAKNASNVEQAFTAIARQIQENTASTLAANKPTVQLSKGSSVDQKQGGGCAGGLSSDSCTL